MTAGELRSQPRGRRTASPPAIRALNRSRRAATTVPPSGAQGASRHAPNGGIVVLLVLTGG